MTETPDERMANMSAAVTQAIGILIQRCYASDPTELANEYHAAIETAVKVLVPLATEEGQYALYVLYGDKYNG